MKLVGYLIIALAISIWFKPVFYSSKYQMFLDYSEQKTLLCFLLLAMGILIIWSTYRKK